MKDLTWKIWHERFDPCALFWHERSNQFCPVQVCATDAVQKLIFEDMTACARSSGLRGYVLSSINISPPLLKYTSTLSRSDCCSFQVHKYTPSVRLMHFLSIQVILLGETDALFKYVSDPPGSNWCTFQVCKWFPLVRLMHFSSLQVSMLALRFDMGLHSEKPEDFLCLPVTLAENMCYDDVLLLQTFSVKICL